MAARSHFAKWLIEGEPKVIGRNGQLDKAALRREMVAEADVMKRLREDDRDLKDVAKVYLETDGQISFVSSEER